MSRQSVAVIALLALGWGTAQAASSSASLTESTGPSVDISETYTLRWHTSVYNDTTEFCQDWDEECVTYLGSFSDRYRVYCDAAARGPDVQVFCGGNTVNRPDEYFDYTSNNQRFVSASLVAGPGEHLEPTPSSTLSPSSTPIGSSEQASSSTEPSHIPVTTVSTHSATPSSSSLSTVPSFIANATTAHSAKSASTSTSLVASPSTPDATLMPTTASLDESLASSSTLIISPSRTSTTPSTSSRPATLATSSSFVSTSSLVGSAHSTTTRTALRPTATGLPPAVVAAQRAADRARRQAEAWLASHRELAARRAREWDAKKAAWLESLARTRREMVEEARRVLEDARRATDGLVDGLLGHEQGKGRTAKAHRAEQTRGKQRLSIEDKLEAQFGKRVMGLLGKYIDGRVEHEVKEQLAVAAARKKKRRQHGHGSRPGCH
ncbi:hypothetical protein JCM11491_004252 [Sporobolomyces phaffii]